LKAAFGKWLGRECGLLISNPFANVNPPKCDDPDVRIVSAAESKALFDWLGNRWNNWRLPLVYLEVATLLGWRATEVASIREEDLLPDGYVRVAAENCKTRRHKYGWLPSSLYADVQACVAGGWAFGRFSDELRRLLMLWKRQPHHARMVRDFLPRRFVGWLQDELKRFNEDREGEPFTLHDFRRTAITGLQMAGASEKETSLMVGATPEVIRKHYEKLDRMAIAKRCVLRRLQAEGSGNPTDPNAPVFARILRAERNLALDDDKHLSQTIVA
jgi:integrase